MNKLHSFAFYALVTPAITLGAGSVLAQQYDERDVDRDAQSTQSEQGQRAGQSDSKSAEDYSAARDEARMQHRGYMDSSPANSMHVSELIGTDVKTTSDEDLGSVDDLIIDENGQVVAIVIGVGGFLGMGEKDVAIGWGHVTTSGTADDRELRVDVTREELRSAPEFERRD
ncbi:PRC-barrel domain-containing protein [Thioalkalivibrio sp. ALM2T]|uniref:PRC-barrel domain-containing protein n=1 Tax=Thioalkalivibrio sp. ALM2T TaxID=1158184 RepID=UPI00036FB0FA|nr:PRC-barrel domain-containing protein [Thioalkalivibrio sp. ALM2T]